MKIITTAGIYTAIVSQQGCDMIKKVTGKEWHELPGGTKGVLIIAGLGLALMLFFIGQYLASPSRPEQK